MSAEPRHAQLRMPDTRPDPFCPFVVAVGLALQGVGLAQNTINFLPEDVKTLQSIRQKPFEIIGMGVMLLAIVGLSFGVGDTYSAKWKDEISTYNQNKLKYQNDNTKIGEAEGRNTKVSDAFTQLAKATGWRDFWFLFTQMAILDQRPADVLVDEIQMRLDGHIVIKGKSPNPSSINAFVDNLMKIPINFIIFRNAEDKASVGYGFPPRPVSDARFTQQVYEYAIVARTIIKRQRIRTFGDQPGYIAPQRLGPNNMPMPNMIMPNGPFPQGGQVR